MNTTPDNITQATDIIFKMRQDGRMDKEEAFLLLDVIFSGEMDEFAFNMIQFINKVRPHNNTSLVEDDEESRWKTIMDFASLPSGGIPIDILLEILKREDEN